MKKHVTCLLKAKKQQCVWQAPDLSTHSLENTAIAQILHVWVCSTWTWVSWRARHQPEPQHPSSSKRHLQWLHSWNLHLELSVNEAWTELTATNQTATTGWCDLRTAHVCGYHSCPQNRTCMCKSTCTYEIRLQTRKARWSFCSTRIVAEEPFHNTNELSCRTSRLQQLGICCCTPCTEGRVHSFGEPKPWRYCWEKAAKLCFGHVRPDYHRPEGAW